MPTALYVQSDTFSPDSVETKQDVQPIWNSVPSRTNSLITKPHINKVLQNKIKRCKIVIYESYVNGKLFKMCPLVLL